MPLVRMISAVASGLAVLAQSLTSLYPILIKRVDTNILTQTTVRFVIFPILALVLGGIGSFSAVTSSWSSWGILLAAGALNLTHVFSSYVAFDELQAGIAMSIFYTYPFWNMIGARIFLGEPLQGWTLPLFAVALFGTYLIASAAPDSVSYKETKGKQALPIRGIIAAVLAALTETGIYLTVRGSSTSNPFSNMTMLYLGGAALLVGALPFLKVAGQSLDLQLKSLVPSGAFNAAIGFTGTTLLFYVARHLPAYMYSILAFVGVITAYIYGVAFADEVPSKRAIGGTGLVLGAIALLYRLR
jgi:drug/metabolite transporter (DMT)-like permease